MKYKYKVSVIVPIYNIEKYLADCLDSLERQTLGNIEVILVCDGPTDSSERIAERYVEKNKHFRKIIVNRDLYNPNCGMMFIKSTLFANKNLHFISRIIYEDNLFYPNLMHMAGKCAVMNEPLHYRRFRNNSVTLSSDNTDKKLTSNYIVVHKMRKMISDFGRTPTVLLPLSRTCYQFSNIYWMQNRQVRKMHKKEYLSVVSVILSERLFGRRFFHHLKKVFFTNMKTNTLRGEK